MSTFCWSRNSIVEDPHFVAAVVCKIERNNQQISNCLSLVLRVLVAVFVKNDSGNDAPFVSTLIGHFHN